ncbi:MAG: hypothetical protein R2694_02630 [Ilumatobacteraceae bacterium]
MTSRPPRWVGATGLVIGLGLASAPALFQMYDRAPAGGDMMVEFEPYMTQQKVDTFNGYMDAIGAAVTEIADLRQQMADTGTLTAEQFDTQYSIAMQLADQWSAIDEDMGDLLARMDRNLGNYDAVNSLPSFDLFPFFFVIPGGLMAMAGLWLLLPKRGHQRGATWALLVLGVGMVLAPVAFQMFTRAPKGAEMIDDFRPMMTVDRVRNVQGYFVTLGAGESQLRATVMPAFEAAGGDAADYPAIAEFSAVWPTMRTDFNPMIATMRDNIDNFEAVDAMPSFDLFPWFFLVPGLIVAGTAGWALRTGRGDEAPDPTTPGGTPS